MFGETGLLTDELLFPCIHIYLTELWLGIDPGFTRSKSDLVHILETPPTSLHSFSRQVVPCMVGMSSMKWSPKGHINLLGSPLRDARSPIKLASVPEAFPHSTLQLEIILMCLMNEHLVGRL